MKNLKLLLFSLLAFIGGITIVNAAPSYTFTVNRNSIENGQSVTATVKVSGTAAWNIKISSAGNTNGCTTSFANVTENAQNTTKSFTATCKSNSIGLISFTLSGDLTASDGSKATLSGTKTVTVTAVTPKSSVNTLKSLSIEGFELSPGFKADTLEYSVELPAETKKINVLASATDGKASVSGTGEKEVSEGPNNIEVLVTAENGSQKTYKITVTVKELEPITITVNNSSYTVIRKAELLECPETYIAATATINGESVPAFYSEITGYTLVGLKDADGKIALYIYNEDKNSFEEYLELKFQGLIFIVLPTDKNIKGYSKFTTVINDREVETFKISKNSEYAIVYGMNVATGDEGFYLYDSKENTLQRYYTEELDLLDKKTTQYFYVAAVFGGGLLLSIITIIALSAKMNKLKKISKKKETIVKKEVVEEKKPQETPKKEEKEKISTEEDDIEKQITQMYDIFTKDKKKK